MQPVTNRIKGLIDELLDREYFDAAEATLNAVGTNATGGRLGQSLQALRVEAQRLAGLNQSLSPDNAVYRSFRADLDRFMQSSSFLLDSTAPTMQSLGLQAAETLTKGLAFGDVNDAQLQLIGVQWNRPNPEAVNALVNYVNSPAWQDSLGKYVDYIPSVANKLIVQGFVSGRSAITIVDDLTAMMNSLPRSEANSLLRSVQLTSYRDATVIQQVANADIIDYVIRIAALDNRTCLSCIALHGTRLEVGERVDDHRNGRCTSISVVKGRPRSVESGEFWLNNQTSARQQEIMGQANYNAWKAGAVQLNDFVHKGTDPIFGNAVTENSLKGILGEEAQRYYARNQ